MPTTFPVIKGRDLFIFFKKLVMSLKIQSIIRMAWLQFNMLVQPKKRNFSDTFTEKFKVSHSDYLRCYNNVPVFLLIQICDDKHLEI